MRKETEVEVGPRLSTGPSVGIHCAAVLEGTAERLRVMRMGNEAAAADDKE